MSGAEGLVCPRHVLMSILLPDMIGSAIHLPVLHKLNHCVLCQLGPSQS